MIPLPLPAQRLSMRDRPRGFPVMRPRWSKLLLLHWPIDPAEIQRTLPKGLYVDTFEGKAWVGVVPFFMERIRPLLVPPVPGISWFLEMNVRTYVHDEHGNSGVWFYSLDCNQPLAVAIARRFFHLPYHHAAMSVGQQEGDSLHYHCKREAENTASRYIYGPKGEPRVAALDSFEFFLLERYLLFSTSRSGGIFTGRVYHKPYPLTDAVCDTWSSEPIRQAGLPIPEGEPVSKLYSPGVNVWVYPLRRTPTADEA